MSVGSTELGTGKCVNHPPTAANIVAATPQNVPMSLSTAKLVALASDPDGNPLSVSALSPTSTNGAPVVLSSGAILYTPPTNYLGADRFTYTVSDGFGGTASAFVLINVWAANQPSGNMFAPAHVSSGYQVSFFGLPGHSYTIQRATNLTGPWVTLGSVTTDGSGLGAFVDTNAPPTGAFYRTTCP